MGGERIYFGEEVEDFKFKSISRMREKLCRGGGKDLQCDKHPTAICGGTIVNREWILTSGHCCYNEDYRPRDPRRHPKTKSPDTITFGIKTLYDQSCIYGTRCDGDLCKAFEDQGEIVNVSELHLHPKFVKNRDASYAWDFCLAKVSPIDFDDRAQPAIFSDTFFKHRNLKAISECVVAGWGKTENATANVELLETNVAVLSKSICAKTYGNKSDIFCGGLLNTPHAHDSCNGDSGGPFYCKNQNGDYIQYGLISGGIKGTCGQKNVPGFYSKVAIAIDWMKRIAGNVKTGTAEINKLELTRRRMVSEPEFPERFTISNSKYSYLNGAYLKGILHNGKPTYSSRCGIMFYDIDLRGWRLNQIKYCNNTHYPTRITSAMFGAASKRYLTTASNGDITSWHWNRSFSNTFGKVDQRTFTIKRD